MVFDFLFFVLACQIKSFFLELMKVKDLLVKISKNRVILNRSLVLKFDIFPDVRIEIDLVLHELFLGLIDLNNFVVIFFLFELDGKLSLWITYVYVFDYHVQRVLLKGKWLCDSIKRHFLLFFDFLFFGNQLEIIYVQLHQTQTELHLSQFPSKFPYCSSVLFFSSIESIFDQKRSMLRTVSPFVSNPIRSAHKV